MLSFQFSWAVKNMVWNLLNENSNLYLDKPVAWSFISSQAANDLVKSLVIVSCNASFILEQW